MLAAAGLIAAGVPLIVAQLLAVAFAALVDAGIERVAIRPIGNDVTRGIIITNCDRD